MIFYTILLQKQLYVCVQRTRFRIKTIFERIVIQNNEETCYFAFKRYNGTVHKFKK